MNRRAMGTARRRMNCTRRSLACGGVRGTRRRTQGEFTTRMLLQGVESINESHDRARRRVFRSAPRRLVKTRMSVVVEHLEPRCLLTIYDPIGIPSIGPSPVEGTAFAGVVVGTFASSDPLAGLSATINWGPMATPTSSIGTINLIGSV